MLWSSVGKENLKRYGTRENTLLWKLLLCTQNRKDLVMKLFSRLECHYYICIYGTISVSFEILTDSIIIIFPMTSLHMQARKAHDECYRYHLFIIQLCYSSVYRMRFVDIYIYIYRYKQRKRPCCGKTLLFYLLQEKWPRQELFPSYFFVCISIWEWHNLVMHSIYCIAAKGPSKSLNQETFGMKTS